MAITLTLKRIETAPLKITVAIPPENPKIRGYFIGNAKIRTKDENVDLGDRITGGEYDSDADIVRDLYESFEGLGDDTGPLQGDAAMDAVTKGPLSAYLIPAVLQAYHLQYMDARQGNSSRRHSR